METMMLKHASNVLNNARNMLAMC